MEDNNSMNSCLMLAIGLYTPVELGSIFDSADYKGTGLEQVTKKLEEYLDECDKKESNINCI